MSDTIHFLVQGSAQEPYSVSFTKDGDNITAYCDCRAGQFGSFCKHRVLILEGSTKGVVSENTDQVAVVASWLPGTDVEAALRDVHEAQKVADSAKKKLKDAKARLSEALED